MSVFDENMIEQSSDWAIEQMYDYDCYIHDREGLPLCMSNKESGENFVNPTYMFDIYQSWCSTYDALQFKLFGEPREHNRLKFINYVKENCDIYIEYKNHRYYSMMWFEKEFYDPVNHYFDF